MNGVCNLLNLLNQYFAHCDAENIELKHMLGDHSPHSAELRRAVTVVSYWQKYVHTVLMLRGLCLLRKKKCE